VILGNLPNENAKRDKVHPQAQGKLRRHDDRTCEPAVRKRKRSVITEEYGTKRVDWVEVRCIETSRMAGVLKVRLQFDEEGGVEASNSGILMPMMTWNLLHDASSRRWKAHATAKTRT
jgi:hypothetical protein